MTRLRCWLDARALERALRVFFRRQWHDLPNRDTPASITVGHLEERIGTLREESGGTMRGKGQLGSPSGPPPSVPDLLAPPVAPWLAGAQARRGDDLHPDSRAKITARLLDDLFLGWVSNCQDGQDCDEHLSLRAAFRAGWEAKRPVDESDTDG